MIHNFDQNSPEHRGNGHYEIGGIQYMSIWTFLNSNNLRMPDNETTGTLTMRMESKFGLYPYKGIMEIGRMKGEYVQLHRVEDLKNSNLF